MQCMLSSSRAGRTASFISLLMLVALMLGWFLVPAQANTLSADRPASIVVATNFDTTLEPGVWHGFVMGPSSLKRAYIAEISPLQPSVDGAHIERYVVQPEFNGREWNDVLRVQIPAGNPALTVHIRVYAIQPQ
jgi:hypothetical protein